MAIGTALENLDFKLWKLRFEAMLAQQDVADLSWIGVKTLSSFETGRRIKSIKVAQLAQLLDVYGVTLSEFFAETNGTDQESPLDAVRPQRPNPVAGKEVELDTRMLPRRSQY